MLHSVKMTCWKQHLDRTITFTPGVNGIRAPNGSGKSNALMACRYALYGTKALDESLEDVVTYDTPVSKLKVELHFDFAGVDYKLTRGKSGAELTFGRDRVTGQTEVTRFIENLFNAPADLAAKLMFAKQKDVGGALEAGPTAASALIESLADLDLIDMLVGLVGEHLPAGNTAVQQSQASTLREQAVEVNDSEDLPQLRDAAAAARAQLDAQLLTLSTEKAKLADLDIAQANEILSSEYMFLKGINSHKAEIAAAQVVLDLPPVTEPGAEEIEALRALAADQKNLASALKLHDELKRANVIELWDESLEALHAEIGKAVDAKQKADADQDQARAALRDAEKAEAKRKSDQALTIAKLQGKLVLEESCAFCGKDLKDIPQVALNNNPLYAQIEALKAEPAADLSKHLAWVEEKAEAYRTAFEYHKALTEVDAANNKLATLYARAEKYITLDESVVPAQWTWIGPTDEPKNYQGQLDALLQQQRLAIARKVQADHALGQRTAAQASLESTQRALANLQIAEAQDTLKQQELLVDKIAGLEDLVGFHRNECVKADASYNYELQDQQQRKTLALKAKEQLAAVEMVLEEMEANNALVKKLRAARPLISDQLWATVLGAASTYYSQMRGDRHVFTRASGKFQVNGRPASGMSGAEKDIFGLGIRMALTRMFLPLIDFLVLDEVAAACDDTREASILGLLSTIGFAQVILVTHSSAIEAVADNIINID